METLGVWYKNGRTRARAYLKNWKIYTNLAKIKNKLEVTKGRGGGGPAASFYYKLKKQWYKICMYGKQILYAWQISAIQER